MQFELPVYPAQLTGVATYVSTENSYDMYVYSSLSSIPDSYIEGFNATPESTNEGWYGFNLTDMNISIGQTFCVSIMTDDVYGPLVGIDSNSSGNSYYYNSSIDQVDGVSEGNWGIRVEVQYTSGSRKIVSPTRIQRVIPEISKSSPEATSKDADALDALHGFSLGPKWSDLIN